MIENCKKSHIYVEGFDGGIISNNTFFFPSYTTQNNTKEYNIYIDYCNWTIITDNNLFESGYESILLKHSQSVRVANNNIAWSGQRIQLPSIHIMDFDVSGNQRFNSNALIGNNIVFGSGNGIKCENVGRIICNSNTNFP